MLVASGRLHILEARIAITLNHCLAAVADLIAEMNARVLETNRLFHLDIEFPHPLAFKTSPGDDRLLVVRFDPRLTGMILREVVKAMLWCGHVQPHPGAFELPN